MIKLVVVLRINLRVKDGRRLVGVAVFLERDVMVTRIGNINIEKVIRFILLLKNRIKIWRRWRKKEGIKMIYNFWLE